MCVKVGVRWAQARAEDKQGGKEVRDGDSDTMHGSN